MKHLFIEHKGRFLAINPYREKSYTAGSESQEAASFRRMVRLWEEWLRFLDRVESSTQADWVKKILHSFTTRYFSTSMAIKLHILEVTRALNPIISQMSEAYPVLARDFSTLKAKKIRLFNPEQKSKHRGVCWFEARGCWRSRIETPDGEEVATYHEDEIEAALAYDEKALEHYPTRPEFQNFVLPGEFIRGPEWSYKRKRAELVKYFRQHRSKAPKKGVYSMSNNEVDEQYELHGIPTNDGTYYNERTD